MANSKPALTSAPPSSPRALAAQRWGRLEQGLPKVEHDECRRLMVKAIMAGESEKMDEALTEFRGLRSRLQLNGEWNHVLTFYGPEQPCHGGAQHGGGAERRLDVESQDFDELFASPSPSPFDEVLENDMPGGNRKQKAKPKPSAGSLPPDVKSLTEWGSTIIQFVPCSWARALPNDIGWGCNWRRFNRQTDHRCGSVADDEPEEDDIDFEDAEQKAQLEELMQLEELEAFERALQEEEDQLEEALRQSAEMQAEGSPSVAEAAATEPTVPKPPKRSRAKDLAEPVAPAKASDEPPAPKRSRSQLFAEPAIAQASKTEVLAEPAVCEAAKKAVHRASKAKVLAEPAMCEAAEAVHRASKAEVLAEPAMCEAAEAVH
eukprot:s9_g22.t1